MAIALALSGAELGNTVEFKVPLYDVYERDGAVFRGPPDDKIRFVTEVYHSGIGWVRYDGDRVKPVVFGDYLGRREYPDPPPTNP